MASTLRVLNGDTASPTLVLTKPHSTGSPKRLPSIADDFESAKRRLFTVEEYNRMGTAGILDEDERVELLDGEIIRMSPIGPRHVSNVNQLTRFFILTFDGLAIVSTQNPIVTDRTSEPQPDIVLLRQRKDRYSESLPTAADVLLIVEVSDTTLHRDRSKKLAIYGRAGVPEYWIVNLLDDTLEVYRVPTAKEYGIKKVLTRKNSIAALAFPKKKIAVRDLLLPISKN